ncbi:MAG TPA: NAD-dependent epimerase/dehydratase family protein [Crocinitomix sp.]|nr:NAD-dependent epimerase/dehydratase family protein [Crocinitomix sp.]
MSKKKLVITGGAGFIGSAFISNFNSEYEIFVIDNLSFGNKKFISDVIDNQHFFKEDVRNSNAIKSIFKTVKPHIVLHLAAVHFIPYCNEHPYESADINISGTINVLNACEDVGVEKIIFASTAAVYPISNVAVSENHPTGPLDIYGLSKLSGEHLCNEFYLKTNTPTIICRFFNAFGPNETNPHLIPEIQLQINEGKRTIQLGNLEPKRDFIHTYDMAKALRLLIDIPIKGVEIYNLGRGIEYSVKEIVEAFERQLGEKITIEQNPDRMRKSDRMHLLADVSKLKKLGWNPTWSIDDGVKTLIDFSNVY